MRWFVVVAACALIVWGAGGCDKLPATPAEMGTLVFQKDSTCADTTNTELFVDAVSQGQYTMRPGSTVGFQKTATTHFANATELAGQLRHFASQAVVVPPLGQATYLMKCAAKPPTGTTPSRPSPPGR
jgi:hypothetical protein